jgi:type I restriction enzyme M protein
MDASQLGTKEKLDGRNQRTVLNPEEINKIIDYFNNQTKEDDFCVTVSYADIAAKKYVLSAGPFFDVKFEYVELSAEEFDKNIRGFVSRLDELLAESQHLETEIKKQLERITLQ